MTIQELHRVLACVGIEPTPEELADVLWLAMRLPVGRRDGSPSESAAETRESQRDEPSDDQPPLDADPERDSLDIRLAGPAPGPARARLAAGPTLHPVLPLARGLRPLRRQRVPGVAREIDDQATADFAAEQRLWIPVLRPVSEPAFDLALVIDVSESMALWAGLARGFEVLCEQLAAFRRIRVWNLVSASDGSPMLAAPGAGFTSQLRDPGELLDPSGRQLILAITDGVHPGWLPSGAFRTVLARWSAEHLTAVIQPFPQRLWDRSALRTTPADVRIDGHGGYLARDSTAPHRRTSGTAWLDAAWSAAIPVLELRQDVLARWAGLVSESTAVAKLAVMPRTATADPGYLGFAPTAANALNPSADPADLVRAFRRSVSPEAYRLAGYFSVVAPLSLPVMRLVQETALQETRAAELAEVFLGGLLRRLPNPADDIEGEPTYGFAAGVRDVLQSTITRGEAVALIDQVGSYLVRRQRSGRSFPVIVTSPTGGDILTASEKHPPFARVASKVFQRLGGPFTEAARHIAQAAQTTESTTSQQTATGTLPQQPTTTSKTATQTIRGRELLPSATTSGARTGRTPESVSADNPYFYLSYAYTPKSDPNDPADPDIWISKLYKDICRHILSLSDVRPGQQIGFMERKLRQGSGWPMAASQALATCRVFVPLYSRRYFESTYCGKEWSAFSRRMVNQAASSRRPPEGIIPALWVPVERDRLPAAAQAVQFVGSALSRSYAEHGFYGIMRLQRFQDDYEEAVYMLARRIVEVAENSPIQPGPPVDYGSQSSAFGDDSGEASSDRTTAPLRKDDDGASTGKRAATARRMCIVIAGPPGAGKGTQAHFIASHLAIPRISTGDIFRYNVANSTELGTKATEYMDRGDLVPDEITVAMIRDRLAENDAKAGFLLDGFPRNVPQAETLKNILAETGTKLTVVLELVIDEDEVVRRLSGRRTCRRCERVWHMLHDPPSQPGTCDDCGGELFQRDDDKEEVIQHRIEVYNSQTASLIAFYADEGILIGIDATGPVEEVTTRALTALGPFVA